MPETFRAAAPAAVIRLATLPRSHADITRIDLAPDQEGYQERLAGYLATKLEPDLATRGPSAGADASSLAREDAPSLARESDPAAARDDVERRLAEKLAALKERRR